MDPLIEKLSEEQREILKMLMEGRTAEQIGERLQMSAHMVRIHATSAGSELAVESPLA